ATIRVPAETAGWTSWSPRAAPIRAGFSRTAGCWPPERARAPEKGLTEAKETTMTDRATDLDAAVREHCTLFNASVRSGDWAPFVATFSPDAHMDFVNIPAGPYHGREAIAVAYAAQPPDDTMTIQSVTDVDGDTARARFSWDRGGEGTMTVRWRDGQV